MPDPIRPRLALHDFTQDPNANSMGPGNGAPSFTNFINQAAAAYQKQIAAQNPDSDTAVPEQLIDYNDKFKDADPALFRDEVIAATMSALISQRKPNALLIGPAGCGKTAIAEEIARRIANNDPSVPKALENTRIMEFPISSVVSGSQYVGQLEAKLDAVINYAKNPDNDVVLFIDEIHQLVSDDQSYAKIGQILKPALARGDLRVIGATTTQESRNLDNDPAFRRRFTKVIVDELTAEQTAVIMEAIWPSMNKHYGNCIMLEPGMLSAIVHIADELGKSSNHRPDNAITLLDRSCADAVIQKHTALAKTKNQNVAQTMANQPIPLRIEHIRTVALKQASGHAMPDSLNNDALTDALERIKGQDRSLVKIQRELRKRDLRLFETKKPLSMLFAGPSGVGKTEVARIISRVLFHIDPLILNMTEYSDDQTSLNRLLGSTQGFIGSDWNNELPLDSLESNPYQLIVLDEFEKASKPIQRIFMGALEDGYIETARHKLIDFSHAIVIATTNAGHSAGAHRTCGFGTTVDTVDPDLAIAHDLKAWFDSELMNRFTMLTTFSAIDRDTYRTIVAETWTREVASLKAKGHGQDLPDELDDDTLNRLVAESYVPDFGARPATKTVQTEIEERLLA